MTPLPCTCGETATGLVVEGHLHPYCAWQAERARAERLRAGLARIAKYAGGETGLYCSNVARRTLAADAEATT